MNQVCLLHIMNKKVQEKKKAIEMRKKGCSYKDILQEVDVAKSTLSNWLKNFPLTDDEKSVLKKRRDANISRGRIRAASVLRNNRLKREQKELCIAKDIFELHLISSINKIKLIDKFILSIIIYIIYIYIYFIFYILILFYLFTYLVIILECPDFVK